MSSIQRGLTFWLIFVSFQTLFFHHSQAQIWNTDSKKVWSEDIQIKYSNWVSGKLGTDFFKSLGRPYTKLRLDCADAHYALLAYFARQEGLPFIIDRGKLSNMTTRFNSVANENERFVDFIKYIAGSYGTEALVHNDTFPISFRSLRPGDLFMYKIGSSNGVTRHTYIIKNINPDGTFDVVYSTQAAAASGLPLYRKESHMFNHAPTNRGDDANRWGFRRQKPAHLASQLQENIPGADFSQYDLARQYKNDPLAFFREVKKANQTISESPQRLISRNLNNICGSMNDRVESVNQAQAHLAKTNNQCMGFQNYDAYSTPSRDSGLADEYLTLSYDYSEIANRGQTNRIGKDLLDVTEASLNHRRTQNEDQVLTQFCKVEFTTGPNGYTNIGRFFDALFDGKVSYHPNDNIHRRWGYEEGRKTTCEEFYGYARPIVRNIR